MKIVLFSSTFGPFSLCIEKNKLVYVDFGTQLSPKAEAYLNRHFPHAARETVTHHPYVGEILAYFAGERKTFSIPIALCTTSFQTKVLQTVSTIPYGHTLSYKDIGVLIGNGGYRAIGSVLKANPIPLVIPCHRVIGSHSLGGFSMGDGLATKRKLLELEQTHSEMF